MIRLASLFPSAHRNATLSKLVKASPSPVLRPEHADERCLGVCAALLNAERALVIDYDKALASLGGDASEVRAVMQKLRNAHAGSVTRLEQLAVLLGGTGNESKPAWDAVVDLVHGAGDVFADRSLEASLLAGEKRAEEKYRGALDDQSLAPCCRTLIQNELLPRVRRSILRLKSLVGGIGVPTTPSTWHRRTLLHAGTRPAKKPCPRK